MRAVPISEIDTWFRVGNNGAIWVVIEDTALNYVFDWDISGAYMDVSYPLLRRSWS